MDFSRLPKTAFLKIFEYLQLEDYVRAGRVNNTFRQIGQLAISRTKSLNFYEDRFRKLTPDQLAIILNLCSPNLERIKFGCDNPDDDHWKQLASTFANYQCPRLIDVDLRETAIDHDVFHQLIRNCPNMESLEWKEFIGYPPITNNSLKKLRLYIYDDASLQTLIGRCPNLEEMDLNQLPYGGIITVNVLDQFFASTPHVRRISMSFRYMAGVHLAVDFDQADMANFYNLRLTELSIDIDIDDSAGDLLLYKVITSFPHLRELSLGKFTPTNQGIGWLTALQDLEVLLLHLSENGEPYDQGFRALAHCRKLQRLHVYQSDMTGGTLVNLVRSCPQLELVMLSDITEVDSPEEAVVILDSLAGLPKRDITIRFYISSENFESVWKGEAAKASIKKLEENDGVKIRIEKDY